nr:conserved Plasmodium protein, unknown function [Plasmodium sp. DRC-Itaito]
MLYDFIENEGNHIFQDKDKKAQKDDSFNTNNNNNNNNNNINNNNDGTKQNSQYTNTNTNTSSSNNNNNNNNNKYMNTENIINNNINCNNILYKYIYLKLYEKYKLDYKFVHNEFNKIRNNLMNTHKNAYLNLLKYRYICNNLNDDERKNHETFNFTCIDIINHNINIFKKPIYIMSTTENYDFIKYTLNIFGLHIEKPEDHNLLRIFGYDTLYPSDIIIQINIIKLYHN